ncbi:MAG: flagellar biosynthetic protein FliQ, partial [Pygmaiobacter massiliensis]
METGQVMSVLREGVGVALKLGGPMLILSMAVGVLVAIFQAVT